MADMLPKLFFVHFRQTSFVAENGNILIGFIVGFISQTFPQDAYIHFVGIHPEHRKRGVGKALYGRFFQTVKRFGCERVCCVTSLVNQGSIAFHLKLGFCVEPSGERYKKIFIIKDYDGKGADRVLFSKPLIATE